MKVNAEHTDRPRSCGGFALFCLVLLQIAIYFLLLRVLSCGARFSMAAESPVSDAQGSRPCFLSALVSGPSRAATDPASLKYSHSPLKEAAEGGAGCVY